ncbi:MAG: hypothetical protein ACLQLG_04970 [Thermoguttaceae bacterium]
MAIRVVCRNGHVLKVTDSSAGKSGLCPVCKVPVQIPPKKAEAMTEDSLMDLLGPQEGDPSPGPREWSAPEPTKQPATVQQAPPRKTCIKCNREMDLGVRICPHCKCYVGGAGDRH